MKKEYGPKKGMKVYYATKNKIDHGFYGHMTHASMQANEDSVKVIGTGNNSLDLPSSYSKRLA